MAKLNISQAAKVSGKSRSTIQRHIKSGKLSVSQNAAGETEVDTSELLRVFGELCQDATVAQHVPDASKSGTKQHHDTGSSVAIEVLQKELEAAKNREREATEREKRLWEQLNAERERSKELERRLLPQPEAISAFKKRRWPWQK